MVDLDRLEALEAMLSAITSLWFDSFGDTTSHEDIAELNYAAGARDLARMLLGTGKLHT